ncbi:hypothetical protein [Sphingomonas morindae]|uniref:Uncharacterized protein n=1 Tax=Sphingomonas morindae TaxID=1541170 RepID=A0ABY4XE63_9SPHN|nr:hypothetical protein [Sphingomonas morindae]USI75242.1 hypothetical protein LHA26_19890 [Sphingomonas morindae]
MTDPMPEDRMDAPDRLRVQALVQVNLALRDEARPVPPDKKRWVYGFNPQGEGHGFPELWVPRPLMFWSCVLRGGWEEGPEQLNDPGLSLAPWPNAEQAIRAYLQAPKNPAGASSTAGQVRSDDMTGGVIPQRTTSASTSRFIVTCA